MEEATAQYLFDLLHKLDDESTPYSCVEVLYGNELQDFPYNLSEDISPGVCLISDNTRKFWFIIADWKENNDYAVEITTENKQQWLATIRKEEWTYNPKKRDGRNEKREKRFESIFRSTTVPIPFPSENVSIYDFLDHVFDAINIRRWADALGDEQPPELRLRPERDPGDVNPEPNVASEYGVNSALQDIFFGRAQLERILYSIERRKNLILQGPPGVGKTFVAKRIAWCLIGCEDSDPVEMVQFHQSYAYEDFVQGWRPAETGGFTLRNGVFFEFCKRAGESPNTPFVFIIDEINRGNLSRIFGELLMLIEADKRGPEYAIPLTYSATGERFSVPENVHILGLMNTADRSLAMVDYALRRRFAFETLEPAYRTEEFRKYLIEAGADEPLVDRIDDSISAINERIREDKDLGPGFQIGHSYFVPGGDEDSPDERWFRTIIETQIEPLLREYWFDRPETVDELLEALRP